MSEPTKEAIEEARKLKHQYAGIAKNILFDGELAHIIAHVRKQARDDALEVAASEFDALDRQRPDSVIYCHGAAIRIRAMKTQGDAQ